MVWLWLESRFHLLVALVFILLVFIDSTSILHWLLILIYVAKMTNIWCEISFVLSNVFAQSLLISSLPWCSAIETMATSILPISFPNDKEDDQLAPLPTYFCCYLIMSQQNGVTSDVHTGGIVGRYTTANMVFMQCESAHGVKVSQLHWAMLLLMNAEARWRVYQQNW